MANYLSARDGGKTNEQGLFQWLGKMFSKGNPTVGTPTSLAVTQRGAGANMSVDIAVGDVSIADTSYNYYGFTDAIVNKSVSSSDPTNPRRDIVVVYVDKSVVSSVSNNNPNALNFAVVAGTPAGSPADPSGATIQAAVGAGNPYVQLARVAVAASASSIVNANITDLRQPISFIGRLWGGASNTNGHIVPNVADDTVALIAATQTLSNKTLDSTTIINSLGWGNLSVAPNTITALGNRSYSCVFNAVDLTGTVSNGMRLRFTRTVAAPTQCTSLNGTTQYYSRASGSVNGMSFTNNFVVSAWIKLSSYATGGIISRTDGTNGFQFFVNNLGQLQIQGFNANGANYRGLTSYQSVPLNKWVHVAVQLDMSSFTASPTTMFCMIDGVDVPIVLIQGGTNPTSLIQAGNLNIGAINAANFFPGKIAQVAIYSAKVTEATILASMNQGLVGNETSLISAYSFNNSINDLNANANNLTANGSAVATNADSPFAQGATAGTLEYGIVTSNSFSTNTTLTVQVPEGSAIPTTGGVSAVSYSSQKTPYGFPAQRGKWQVSSFYGAGTTVAIGSINNWFVFSAVTLSPPIGEWIITAQVNTALTSTVSGVREGDWTISPSGSIPAGGKFNDSLTMHAYQPSSSYAFFKLSTSKAISVSAVVAWYLYVEINSATGAESSYINPGSEIFVECAYL